MNTFLDLEMRVGMRCINSGSKRQSGSVMGKAELDSLLPVLAFCLYLFVFSLGLLRDDMFDQKKQVLKKIINTLSCVCLNMRTHRNTILQLE